MHVRNNPKLIFLTTEDWYFCSHRLPMARAARDAGFSVGVATRVGTSGDQIRAEGFALHPLHWSRGSISPTENIGVVRQVTALYRHERPDIVHHVALKPIILGSLAASAAGVRHVVNGPTGLGYLFTSSDLKAKLLRASMLPILKLLLRRTGSMLLLQNIDDRARLARLGIVDADRIVIIRGSGVDIDHFTQLPFPDGEMTLAFAGRLLEIKGIRVLVEAHRILRRRGVNVRLLVAGSPDSEHPGSIPQEEIEAWRSEPGIELLGTCADIRQVWARCHIAVLPSLGGEGLPKSLLEAAACGRPIVATDVAGSREIAIAGKNALVVPPMDAPALADAIERLAGDASLRARFGAESRRLVESDMSEKSVSERIAQLYRRLLADQGK